MLLEDRANEYALQILRNVNHSPRSRALMAAAWLSRYVQTMTTSEPGSADRLSNAWTWMRPGVFVVGPLPGRKPSTA